MTSVFTPSTPQTMYPALSSASVPPAAPPTGYYATPQRAAAPSFGYADQMARHPPHGFWDRGLYVEPQRLHRYQTQLAAPASSQYPPIGRAPRSVYGSHPHAQLQGCNKRAVPARTVLHATPSLTDLTSCSGATDPRATVVDVSQIFQPELQATLRVDPHLRPSYMDRIVDTLAHKVQTGTGIARRAPVQLNNGSWVAGYATDAVGSMSAHEMAPVSSIHTHIPTCK